MPAQVPAKGRIVHVLVDPGSNNGDDVAPAMITAVFSDTCVNARIMHDGPVVDGHQRGRQEWVTSIGLHEDEASARLSSVPHAALWPPRV